MIRSFKPDVVHAYGWFSYSGALALLGTNIPLLISARDYGYSCATRTLVYRGEQVCDWTCPAQSAWAAQRISTVHRKVGWLRWES